MAALGCTLAIAIFSGALCGFISSKIGSLDYQFDDEAHFEGVDFADQIARYSASSNFKHEKSATMRNQNVDKEAA